MITKVARAIWTTIKKTVIAIGEAKRARAEWELEQYLRTQGYKNLSEYQKERLHYYKRANF